MSKVVPSSEGAATAVVEGIQKQGGKFICSEGKVFILINGNRVEISPAFDNHSYAAIQIKYCGLATAELKGKAVCQRVAVLATQLSTEIRLAKFSALSKDKTRLYLPIEGGDLLQITASGLERVPNGANPDAVWVEHPKQNPFKFLPECNVAEALREFERLCVKTQACSVGAQKWLVAMHEGLLPYVRDFATARMLVQHIGPSQQGKTSGAQRFTKLHGIGEVLGDVSPAYLRNSCGDLGLMVLDNKEQANYGQELIDALLFAATGAQYGRSTTEGHAREGRARPVVVLTSIEGMFKRELHNRTINVPYGLLTRENRDRDAIECRRASENAVFGHAPV